MKPYYKTEKGKLYCGDCLEVMPALNKNFDLCLTDPPYGINIGKHKTIGGNTKNIFGKIQKEYKQTIHRLSKWDTQPPSKDIFDLIFELSANQIIFGGNYFAEHFKNSSCWIVWDKMNGKSNFADAELIYTSFKTAVRIIKWRWNGMLQQDMKCKEKRYHPTQKPVKLIELILSKYSKPKENIIDPFAGVGTVAIAAHNMGHSWVIIEQEEKYCEIAAKRIEEIVNQMKF